VNLNLFGGKKSADQQLIDDPFVAAKTRTTNQILDRAIAYQQAQQRGQSSNFNRLFGGSFGNTANQFANSANQFPSIQQPTGFASNHGSSTSNRGFDAIRGGGFGGGGSSLPQLPPPSIGGGSTGQQSVSQQLNNVFGILPEEAFKLTNGNSRRARLWRKVYYLEYLRELYKRAYREYYAEYYFTSRKR